MLPLWNDIRHEVLNSFCLLYEARDNDCQNARRNCKAIAIQQTWASSLMNFENYSVVCIILFLGALSISIIITA